MSAKNASRAAARIACAAILLVSVSACFVPLSESLLHNAKDLTPPVVTILSPTSHSFYTASLSVAGSVADSTYDGTTGKVISCSCAITGTNVKVDAIVGEDGSFLATLSTVGLTGELEITVTAVDWNWNTSAATVKVSNDMAGPLVAFTSPADQSCYAATVPVEGTVQSASTMSGITEVQSLSYEVLNSAIKGDLAFTDGRFSFSFATAGLDGNLIVRVTAKDWHDNVTEADLILVDGGSGIPSLTVTPGNGCVTLTWSEVPLASSYSVYYETSNTAPTASSTRIDGIQSPYTITGLSDGVIHSFQLQSHSSAGSDNWSEAVAAMPLSPFQLSPALTPLFNGIHVAWEPIVGVNEYRLYRSTSPSGPFSYITGNLRAEEYTDTAVSPDTWYYYAVKPSLFNETLSACKAGQSSYFAENANREEGYLDTTGSALGVALYSHYALVADGTAGLRVIDVSNPASPRQVGLCDTPGTAYAVVVDGHYAYVADQGSGLAIIDVSNPASLQLTGTCDTPGSAMDVAVSGSYAYVADGSGGLREIDIQNKTAPSETTYFVTAGNANGVAVQGSYAFVAANNKGIRMINISNPASLTEDDFDAPSGPLFQDVCVSGSYAYVAAGTAGVYVYDVSDIPYTEPGVAYNNGWNTALGVTVAENRLYVSTASSGVRVVDVTTPASPAEVSYFDTMSGAYATAVSERRVYVADLYDGLRILDFGLPTPVQKSLLGYGTSPNVRAVAVRGGYAFVCNDTNGLSIVDVSNPASPAQAAVHATGGAANDVCLVGNYAFVANGGQSLQIVDVSDPLHCVNRGAYTTVGNCFAVAVKGRYAYLAATTQGLAIMDVSDPDNPYPVSVLDTAGTAYDVAIDGDYAYVADLSGLRVVDVSNPRAPAQVATVSGSNICGVAAADGYVYAIDIYWDTVPDPDIYRTKLRVFDISTPSAPIEKTGITFDDGTVFSANTHYNVEMVGQYAYMSGDHAGLRIVDVSDPANCRSVASITQPICAHDVAVAGRYAYVIDNGYVVADTGYLQVVSLDE